MIMPHYRLPVNLHVVAQPSSGRRKKCHRTASVRTNRAVWIAVLKQENIGMVE